MLFNLDNSEKQPNLSYQSYILDFLSKLKLVGRFDIIKGKFGRHQNGTID